MYVKKKKKKIEWLRHEDYQMDYIGGLGLA